MTTDVAHVADYCRAVLSLDDASLSDEYYYAHLPLCVIDAVFSIGVNYASTRNTVSRYCQASGLQQTRLSRDTLPPVEQQQSIEQMIALIEAHGPDHFAHHVVCNRQRTSTTNGILKAEAVLRFGRVLQQHGCRYLQDAAGMAADTTLEREVCAIPGQRSGLSFHYFLMLAGSDDLVKPDRMVTRFLTTVLQRSVTQREAQHLLPDVAAHLYPVYPHLTPRMLDYVIWSYQRTR